MKKLMILGGSRYAVPVIEAAHKLGLYVITCDYLPDNIAHKYSDEYCDVSIIDKEKTLEAAKKLQIDGIVSFACDPGVTTAAYIAEKMGLPFQGSYESTEILQDKGLFRDFLTKHGFNVPHAKRYIDKKAPFNDIDFCMKLRQAGYLIVYNPYAELYHYESKSRGLEDTPEKVARFNKEIATFEKKWPEILKNGDPYYNPNLTLKSQDFSLKRI